MAFDIDNYTATSTSVIWGDLDFGDFALVGSSPEILVRVKEGRVTIRPIAGTHRPVHPALHLLAPAALKDTKHLSQQRLHVLHAQTPCGRVRFLDGSVGRGGTRHRR